MFIVSFKPTLKKFCLTAGCIFIIVFAIAVLVDNGNALAASKGISTANQVSTNEQRVKYIEKFGWKINHEAIEIVDVKIPAEFNDVYNEYNKLQKVQGFNLEKYKGKTVKRYTYEVKNYKDHPEFVRATVLIYSDTIIATDICSLKLDGFMHALNDTKNIILIHV